MVKFQTIHARLALLAVLPATTQHQIPVIAARMCLEPFITNIMV